ncbi:MAG: hypothetical protein VYA17_03830 [Pseudomonadota bacterium]|nr:hypothetical protein [Pseudomonadota bacterium]
MIVEKRPSSNFLGMKRWGELGFIHILSRGHAIHILASEHQHRVNPNKVGKLNLETVVSDENNIKLLLETELSGLKLSKMQMPIVVPNNKNSWTAIDNNVRSSFTIKHPNANLEFEAAESERLACYNVVLPWPRSKNKILDGWKLYGASPNERWTLIDKQDFSRDPKEKLEKYFQVAKGTKQFKRYKFEFVPASNIPEFSIAEIELFTAGAKCRGAEMDVSESDLAQLTRVTKVISTKYNSEIVGFVSEASISNTPFRLQRVFDNRFETFWETGLTDPVEVFLRPETLTPLHCYAFKSGADRAHHRMPKDWSIWGRKIGDQWSLIERRTDNASWQDKEVRTYKTAKQGMFEEYRIKFSKTHEGQYLRLYEIKFSFNKLCSSYVP